MRGGEDDPSHRAAVQASLGGDAQEHAGGPLDVRAVPASVPREAKDAFAFGTIPWDRFPRGPETRAAVALLRSDDPAVAHRALRGVRGELADSAWSACALAVPFVLRVAADHRCHFRSDALVPAAETARRTPGPGLCTREEFLRVVDDGWRVEPSGRPGHRGIQAARDAIAADADLVMALLDDPDAQVRCAAAYTLAATAGRRDDIHSALHTPPAHRGGPGRARRPGARDRPTGSRAPPLRVRSMAPSQLVRPAEAARRARERRAGLAVPDRHADPRRPARHAGRVRDRGDGTADGAVAVDARGGLRR